MKTCNIVYLVNWILIRDADVSFVLLGHQHPAVRAEDRYDNHLYVTSDTPKIRRIPLQDILEVISYQPLILMIDHFYIRDGEFNKVFMHWHF